MSQTEELIVKFYTFTSLECIYISFIKLVLGLFKLFCYYSI